MKHERSITLSKGEEPATTELRHRRAFQAVFGVLALVPLIASLTAITTGAGRFEIDGLPVELDSQLRYLGGIYFVVALCIGYGVLHIERAQTIVMIVGSAVFAGGIGRLASWIDIGRPGGLTLFFIGVELLLVPAAVFAYRKSFHTADTSTVR